MKLFTASDGKDYALDTWHELPFWVTSGGGCKSCACRSYRFPGVPSTGAGNRLLRKFKDGTIKVWSPFTTLLAQMAERENPATHWMVQSWSDYTI